MFTVNLDIVSLRLFLEGEASIFMIHVEFISSCVCGLLLLTELKIAQAKKTCCYLRSRELPSG